MNLNKLVQLSYIDEEEAQSKYNVWLDHLVSKRCKPIKRRKKLQSLYKNKKCIGLVDPAKRCYYSSEDENEPTSSNSPNASSSNTKSSYDDEEIIDSSNLASPSLSRASPSPSYSPTSPNALSTTSAGIEDVSDDSLDIGIGPLIEQDTEIDELLKIVFDDLFDPMTEETTSNNLKKEDIYYITLD